MSASTTFKRVLIYFLLTWTVLTGISSFVAYFYYRSYSPMQPDVETGQIYPLRMKQPFDVSERSKPASKERMKTSHFEERIAFGVVPTAQRRDESTQRELAAFNNDFGGAWLVPPAHCA
jgi:hypothetical protein